MPASQMFVRWLKESMIAYSESRGCKDQKNKQPFYNSVYNAKNETKE